MKKSLNSYFTIFIFSLFMSLSIKCLAGGGTTIGGGPVAMSIRHNDLFFNNDYRLASVSPNIEISNLSEAKNLADQFIDNLEIPLVGIYEEDYSSKDLGSHIELMLEDNIDNCTVRLLFDKKYNYIAGHVEDCN